MFVLCCTIYVKTGIFLFLLMQATLTLKSSSTTSYKKCHHFQLLDKIRVACIEMNSATCISTFLLEVRISCPSAHMASHMPRRWNAVSEEHGRRRESGGQVVVETGRVCGLEINKQNTNNLVTSMHPS
ncbi:uncharacterized protein LOC123502289 isoform X1 [Portunus trituberculatus]|uniref:uncharacterized protein LOC123502289 isoform X1 n=1 Tax=Portunus trituberculatus TaxID=210409 RepID=UPI001E1D0550|nr:uncharacterized protein LOC123502289 isoform X1 [Portunus trituberculatus]